MDVKSDWLIKLDSGKLSTPADKWAWNPKIDLLAATTKYGFVILYGHEFRTVWKAQSVDGSLPCQPAWRPDGQILAVGYESGLLCLFDIDCPQPLYTQHAAGPILYVEWYRKLYDTDAPYMMSLPVILFRPDKSVDSGYVDTLVFCYKEKSNCKHYLEFAAGGMHTLFRMYVGNSSSSSHRLQVDFNNTSFRMQESHYARTPLPDLATFEIWGGNQVYEAKLPIDWDIIHQSQLLIMQISWQPDQKSWIDWCREVWDKLGSLQTIQHKFQELSDLIGHEELRDQLLQLLATGTTNNAKVVEFMDAVYGDPNIRSSSALILLTTACTKLSERLCSLIMTVELKYKCALELIGISEFYTCLRPLYDCARQVQNSCEEICVLAVKICECIKQHSETFLPFFRWFLLTLLLIHNSSNDTLQSIPAELKSLTFDDIEQVEKYINRMFGSTTFQIDQISQFFVGEQLKYPDDLKGKKSLVTLLDGLNLEITNLGITPAIDSVKVKKRPTLISLTKKQLDAVFCQQPGLMIALDSLNNNTIRIRGFSFITVYSESSVSLDTLGLKDYHIVAAEMCDLIGNCICILVHANNQYSEEQDPAQIVCIRKPKEDQESGFNGNLEIFREPVNRNTTYISYSRFKRALLLLDCDKAEVTTLLLNLPTHQILQFFFFIC